MSLVESIQRRKALRAQRLYAALDRVVAQLQELGALKVVLFGSLARDEADVHSDLDLLVIMPSTRTSRQWSRLLHERLERGVATDLIVYNQEDFEREAAVSSLLRNALESGRVVYEEPGRNRGPKMADPGQGRV